MVTFRMNRRFSGVYAALVVLLALHVHQDNGVTSYYLNGLRPVFESFKSDKPIHRGHGIKCFSCSSKTNEACVEPDTSQYEPVHCDTTMLKKMRENAQNINDDYDKIFEVDAAHLGGVNLVCLKVVVKDGNKNYVLRGCQLGLPRNLDICTKVEEKNTGMIKKVHCSSCNKDGCNSSMTSYNLNMALTLVCLAISQAFYKLL